MFKYYDPNPKQSRNDCVKRAICVCSGIDFSLISRQLNAFKKVTGAKTFNSHNNPHHFVEDVLSAEKITFNKKMLAKDFCKTYSAGRFILDMDEHWSACINGDIYDTWDCSEEIVNFAYKISTEPYTLPSLKNQVFKYCCTSEKISDTQTLIRIYDGLGAFVERKIPTELTSGYVRCLQDSNYNYIKL